MNDIILFYTETKSCILYVKDRCLIPIIFHPYSTKVEACSIDFIISSTPVRKKRKEIRAKIQRAILCMPRGILTFVNF